MEERKELSDYFLDDWPEDDLARDIKDSFRRDTLESHWADLMDEEEQKRQDMALDELITRMVDMINAKDVYSGELKVASDKDHLVEEDGETIRVPVIISGLNYFSKARWHGTDEGIEEVVEILDNPVFGAEESLNSTPEILDPVTDNEFSIHIIPDKELKSEAVAVESVDDVEADGIVKGTLTMRGDFRATLNITLL